MSLIDTLAKRTPRERVLLMLLGAGILPVLLAFSVLLPLSEHRRAAEVGLEDAQALNLWVANRASEAASFTGTSPRENTAPMGLSNLEQSLRNANLRAAVSRLEARNNGGIAMEFEAVDFIKLMEWLDAQTPVWGYVITSVRIEPTNAPARVRAAFLLDQGGAS